MSVDEAKDYDRNGFEFPLLSSSLPSGTITSTLHKHHQIRYSFQKKPFIIGVAGGTASGKSSVCDRIIEKLGPIDPKSIYLSHEKRVVRISQDSFYRKLTDHDRRLVESGAFNFDHPEAFDFELLYRTLRDVCSGKMVRIPIYDYEKNEISDDEEVIYPADVVLFEGLLLFYFPELRRFFHMKVFVDTDPDTRLSRRVLKDVQDRKRDLSTVLTQYLKFVKPSFEEYCLPTKKHADIVIPRGPENEVAVELIVTQIRSVYDPSTRHQSIKLRLYAPDDDYQNDEEDYISSKFSKKIQFSDDFKSNREKSNKQEKSTSTSSDTGWYDSDNSENFDEKSPQNPPPPQGGTLAPSSSSVPRSDPIPVGGYGQNDELMYEFDEKFGFQNGFRSATTTIKCGGTKSLANGDNVPPTGSPNTRSVLRGGSHESRPKILI